MRVILSLMVFWVWVFICGVARADTQKVAILPFNIHAPRDLAYVREGIQDMLTTRLFTPGKVETVDPEIVRRALSELKAPLTRETAKQLGQKLGVDYVLFGSVSVFDKTVSVDAELIPVKAEKPPITLYTQVNGLGAVIPELANFAKRSRAYILGEKWSPEGEPNIRTTSPAPIGPPPAPKVQTPSQGPFASPAKMHPEKLVEAPAPAPAPQVPQAPSTPPSKIPPVHYTDVDQWPDYPPPEETLPPAPRSPSPPSPPVSQPQPEKKKKSIFRRIGSKLWPFGKKEKEVKLSEVSPPPPPPPPPAYQAPQSPRPYSGPRVPQPQPQPRYRTYQPPPAPSPSPPTTPAPSQGPPPQGETWQWY